LAALRRIGAMNHWISLLPLVIYLVPLVLILALPDSARLGVRLLALVPLVNGLVAIYFIAIRLRHKRGGLP
jgi:hypothetical protein